MRRHLPGGSGGQSSSYYELLILASGEPRFGVRDEAAASKETQVVTATGKAVNDGKWHHVAAVRDTSGKTLTIYVDGVLATSPAPALTAGADGALSMIAEDSFNIGAQIRCSGCAGAGTYALDMKGAIDELSYHSDALTASEIAAIYAAGATGKCVP